MGTVVRLDEGGLSVRYDVPQRVDTCGLTRILWMGQIPPGSEPLSHGDRVLCRVFRVMDEASEPLVAVRKIS